MSTIQDDTAAKLPNILIPVRVPSTPLPDEAMHIYALHAVCKNFLFLRAFIDAGWRSADGGFARAVVSFPYLGGGRAHNKMAILSAGWSSLEDPTLTCDEKHYALCELDRSRQLVVLTPGDVVSMYGDDDEDKAADYVERTVVTAATRGLVFGESRYLYIRRGQAIATTGEEVRSLLDAEVNRSSWKTLSKRTVRGVLDILSTSKVEGELPSTILTNPLIYDVPEDLLDMHPGRLPMVRSFDLLERIAEDFGLSISGTGPARFGKLLDRLRLVLGND